MTFQLHTASSSLIVLFQDRNLWSGGNNSNGWTGHSTVHVDNRPQNVVQVQQTRPENCSPSKISQSGTKDLEPLFDHDGFYVDFSMDEVDLNIENYEELFGVGHNDPKHLFAKDGVDSLFGGVESSFAGKVLYHLRAL